jgi:hypothetical protein
LRYSVADARYFMRREAAWRNCARFHGRKWS